MRRLRISNSILIEMRLNGLYFVLKSISPCCNHARDCENDVETNNSVQCASMKRGKEIKKTFAQKDIQWPHVVVKENIHVLKKGKAWGHVVLSFDG